MLCSKILRNTLAFGVLGEVQYSFGLGSRYIHLVPMLYIFGLVGVVAKSWPLNYQILCCILLYEIPLSDYYQLFLEK